MGSNGLNSDFSSINFSQDIDMAMRHLFIWFFISVLSLPIATAETIKTQKHTIAYEVITDGLEYPWGMVFLPDGRILVTEKPGRLRLIQSDGRLLDQPVQGLPDMRSYGQGGLLDVALHPQFTANRWVYFSYAETDVEGNTGTTVARGKLQGNRLDNVEVIFRLAPKTRSSRHFGSRLVFDNDGYLFITTGDRGNRRDAQNLRNHIGTLVRLHDDGSIPQDNPFINYTDAKPGIFSYGHRNMQGAAVHPVTGAIWTHEHGPQGGDEMNVPQAGRNYGWPVITYGANYGIGTSIGEGTHKQGMEQPIHYWTPSIAPSGMAFYTGDVFPNWRGNLFIGSLKFDALVRLELDGTTIINEERMLADELGRVRDVRQGPDGLLYLLIDDHDGMLVRLERIK